MTTYYTLAVYDTEAKKWFNDFGDYEKSLVVEEMENLIWSYLEVKPKHIKILKTNHDQQSIDAAINKLNGSK
tara:strand:+ start:300 stop:515 length:216 start_codon:yes stop_codon:yes gene_type:complete